MSIGLSIEIEKLSGQSNCDAATEWALRLLAKRLVTVRQNTLPTTRKLDIELFPKKVALYNQKQKPLV